MVAQHHNAFATLRLAVFDPQLCTRTSHTSTFVVAAWLRMQAIRLARSRSERWRISISPPLRHCAEVSRRHGHSGHFTPFLYRRERPHNRAAELTYATPVRHQYDRCNFTDQLTAQLLAKPLGQRGQDAQSVLLTQRPRACSYYGYDDGGTPLDPIRKRCSGRRHTQLRRPRPRRLGRRRLLR
jgi:hypothetical protein